MMEAMPAADATPAPDAVPRVAGLVLAAGAGRRFGDTPKQLAPLDGRPLLEHALAALAATPGLVRRLVVLGAHAERILGTVDLHGVEPLVVPRWEEGQAASLRAGVAALGDTVDAVVVTLGDQPLVGPDAIAAVVRAGALAGGEVTAARATWRDVPGHPVLLPRALFGQVAALRGDVGARPLLARVPVRTVSFDRGAVVDVDTPAALAAVEASLRSGRGAGDSGAAGAGARRPQR